MDDRCYTIKSLADYVEQINSIKLVPSGLSSPPRLLFRGHSNCEYQLVSSLGRRLSKSWQTSWKTVEQSLVETAQQKFPMLFPSSDYPAILLAKLQHYGIYTRMLDFTDNALVALYFSCCSKEDTDGEVLAVSAQTKSAYNPTVNAIADTYRLTRNGVLDVPNYYYKVSMQPYYFPLLYKTNTDRQKQEALKLFLLGIKDPIFVEVGSICERQKNQGGYFLLFPNKIMVGSSEDIPIDENISLDLVDKTYLWDTLEELPKDSEIVKKRLIIPKELKKTLNEQISRFGITQKFLFADNVDEVCKSIITEHRAYYSDHS